MHFIAKIHWTECECFYTNSILSAFGLYAVEYFHFYFLFLSILFDCFAFVFSVSVEKISLLIIVLFLWIFSSFHFSVARVSVFWFGIFRLSFFSTEILLDYYDPLTIIYSTSNSLLFSCIHSYHCLVARREWNFINVWQFSFRLSIGCPQICSKYTQ